MINDCIYVRWSGCYKQIEEGSHTYKKPKGKFVLYNENLK